MSFRKREEERNREIENRRKTGYKKESEENGFVLVETDRDKLDIPLRPVQKWCYICKSDDHYSNEIDKHRGDALAGLKYQNYGQIIQVDEAHFWKDDKVEKRIKEYGKKIYTESDPQGKGKTWMIDRFHKMLSPSSDDNDEKWCYICKSNEHYSDEDDKHWSSFLQMEHAKYDKQNVLNGTSALDLIDAAIIIADSSQLSCFQLASLKEISKVLVCPHVLKTAPVDDRYDRPIPHYLGLRLKKEYKLCTTAMATIRARQATDRIDSLKLNLVHFSALYGIPRTVESVFDYREAPIMPLLNHGRFMKGSRFF